MRVLRDRRERIETHAFAARLRTLASRNDVQGFLIELGMLEQGVLDAGESGAIATALSHAALAAGEACVEIGSRSSAALARATAIVGGLAPALPRRTDVVLPEGYLHYALDPLAYAEAARRYARDVGASRAARSVVIGVRSIGTSLSAIVAAAIGARDRATVRPRGATGSRSIPSDPALEQLVVERAARGSDVLVVDEGPGVTGETFEAVLRLLLSMGVRADRVRVFPSHPREPELASDARRAFLRGFRAHPPSPIDPRPERVCARFGCCVQAELTGAQRRALLGTGAPWRGVFERRALLARDERGARRVLRWSGIGAAATRALCTAAALEARGVSLGPIEASEGFALWPVATCTELRRARAADRALGSAAARYVRSRAAIAGTGQPASRGPVVQMLVDNALEAGGDPARVAAAARLVLALPQREASLIDGRLAPWTWARVRGAHRKIEAIDAGDGIHLPGPFDATWDLAGACVELRLGERAMEDLARACAGTIGESWRSTMRATCAYLAPYAAFALGDATLCARAAAADERPFWEREIAFYHRALGEALALAEVRAPRCAFAT